MDFDSTIAYTFNTNYEYMFISGDEIPAYYDRAGYITRYRRHLL